MAKVSLETKKRLAKTFIDNGLLKFGEFTLKSGLKSPFYIDLRKAQSHPDAFQVTTDAYIELLADVDQSVKIAGIPEAATPFAAAVGYVTKRSIVQPRKVIKTHGTKSSVEGDYENGDSVVLLDDLITTGESKLETIKQVEDAGLKVDHLIVLFHRQQGGVDAVTKAGYKIYAAMTLTELIDLLLESGELEKAKYDEVTEYIKNS